MTDAVALAVPEASTLDVEQAAKWLRKAARLDEILEVRDRASAIALYQRQRGAAISAINDANEIMLRADRRIGQLVKELEVRPGRPGKNDPRPKLGDLGLTSQDASHCRRIASIPEPAFERFVAKTRAKGEVLTAQAANEMGKFYRTQAGLNPSQHSKRAPRTDMTPTPRERARAADAPVLPTDPNEAARDLIAWRGLEWCRDLVVALDCEVQKRSAS